MKRSLLLTLAIYVAVYGCREADRAVTMGNADAAAATAPTAPWFVDATQSAGLDFVHQIGTPGRYFMPEITGSGAAVLDFDRDGRLDLFLLQNAGPESAATHRLYRQTDNGSFEDVSETAGLAIAGYGMGAAVGDINNDGWSDLLVTEYGRTRLFLNEANGHFRDISDAAGIANPQWGTSACFFDYDRDGWLDLVIANYVDYAPTQECFDQKGNREYCGPSGFPPTVTRLFHNTTADHPDQPTFDDVTAAAGLATEPGPCLGVVCADFDGDRWPDIFLADDAAANRLWINQKDGRFLEEAKLRGIAYNAMGKTAANMGVGLGDADGDGDFDIFVTHLNTETHALWHQDPRGMFQDRTAVAGVTRTQWRGTAFGTVFGDFDRDGALDLSIVNGAIERASVPHPLASPQLESHWHSYAERNQLLRNTGHGKFTDVSQGNLDFCGTAEIGRGIACADFNEDGALDLLVTSVASPARLYLNTASDGRHWLMVRAVDPLLGGRDAYGAEVSVVTPNRSQTRWLNPAYSYLCSNDARCHFGLDDQTAPVNIHIVWPNGDEEAFDNIAVDQHVTLEKGQGTPR